MTKHMKMYDWLTGTPIILNFRQASPHEKVNACQLCPSTKQSEVAEFGITMATSELL